MIRVADEVAGALAGGGAVVALETTLVAHGFPAGEGVAVAAESERAVRAAGAVPATVGVLDGELRIGLSPAELERFDESARKAGPAELAACVARRTVGATTVGGTLAACRVAGIRVLATGGIGGVHRGFATRPDVSADLAALARSPAVVVCSGVKSLLDVEATVEALETLGVPLAGWRTDELPRFYARGGGPPLATRVDSADEAARLAEAHWGVGGAGLVIARPPDDEVDVDPLVDEAVAAAEAEGIAGGAITPFVLARLHMRSGGATLRANRGLVVGNAALAAELAVALATRR
ncbi:MAG: pseudouridine-5'-phosphate glycosidase [Thermoleophilia bacterium]|nr:pseudouridine-5'-phosphate glycosidase [Thermoleophilia bacterium]